MIVAWMDVPMWPCELLQESAAYPAWSCDTFTFNTFVKLVMPLVFPRHAESQCGLRMFVAKDSCDRKGQALKLLLDAVSDQNTSICLPACLSRKQNIVCLSAEHEVIGMLQYLFALGTPAMLCVCMQSFAGRRRGAL